MRVYRFPFLFGAGALLASVFIGLVPTAPAAADVVEENVAAIVSSQTFTTPAVAAPAVARDQYSVTVITVVQWPLPESTGVSSGFGYRIAPCRGCSSDHMGTDFTPGGGAPIWNIADGVVSQVGWNGGLGWCVTVEHEVNGQAVTSIYGHMIQGSSTVGVGQVVARGVTLGLVGDTGASTGNHLHFEVHVGGVPVDSLAWIRANANSEDW